MLHLLKMEVFLMALIRLKQKVVPMGVMGRVSHPGRKMIGVPIKVVLGFWVRSGL